jgi:hypothetical protein
MAISSYIPFPFKSKTLIAIQREQNTKYVEAELASSVIEIFQSACYRSPNDMQQPLVLQFGNPAVQHYCLQNYNFPLEQILVEYGSNKVININQLKENEGQGQFIQSYAGLSCIILATLGFAKQHDIEIQKTYIKL